jgi:hypothetical protein
MTAIGIPNTFLGRPNRRKIPKGTQYARFTVLTNTNRSTDVGANLLNLKAISHSNGVEKYLAHLN